MNSYEKLAASRLLGEMEKQAFKAEALKQFGSRALNAMGRGEAWKRLGKGVASVPGNMGTLMTGRGIDTSKGVGIAGRIGEALGLSGIGASLMGGNEFLKGLRDKKSNPGVSEIVTPDGRTIFVGGMNRDSNYFHRSPPKRKPMSIYERSGGMIR